MNIPSVFWLVPIASIVALGMAWFFFKSMMKSDEGTPRMREIALYVRKGAMAYLKQQYKVVLIVFVVLCATDILLFGSTMGVGAEEPLANKLLLYLVRGALKLGFATSGILALYNTVELVLPRVSDAAKAKWKQVSEISFGVYLCHQFILIALYRHSMLFEAVGSYWMPWIGLLVALLGSVIITYFAIKTKVGAFLMK